MPMALDRPKVRAAAALLGVATLVTVAGDRGVPDETRQATDGASAGTHESDGPPTTAPTTLQRPIDPREAVLAEYDRLYARIAGDPGVRLDPNHALWARWDELLTAESPLRAFWVVSAFDPGDPRNYRQVAGGTRPEQLRPGDRNAELPMIHEMLGDLPEVAGGEVTVPACIHHDFQTFGAQGRGIELSTDAQVSGSVTFRHGADGWRLHTPTGGIGIGSVSGAGPNRPGRRT
jgi:hypothetical protein